MNAGIDAVDFHGLQAWRLRAAGGAAALVSAQGAQLLSWTTPDGRERLYLSPRSRFGAGAAIRGGVPVVFPQFAASGPLPRHGFARTARWRLAQSTTLDGVPTACFELRDDAATRAAWPFAFRATLELRLEAAAIEVALGVENCGRDAFGFTAALHSYLRVDPAGAARIGPLEGADWTVDGAIDRVFPGAAPTLRLGDAAGTLAIRHDGFPDAVVWNPGPAGAAALADMPPDGWRSMLCVEAGLVERPLRLGPGQGWRGRQRLDAAA